MVYVTRGLLDVLLEFAGDADPGPFSASLSVTPAADLSGASELPPEAPVFTDFYLPGASGSVSAVFGVDLATPAGQTPGVFVSHPDGDLGVSRTDDLREVVLVAVPPWTTGDVAAFGRRGDQRSLTVVDAAPAEEPFS